MLLLGQVKGDLVGWLNESYCSFGNYLFSSLLEVCYNYTLKECEKVRF